jgi:DNA-binding protein
VESKRKLRITIGNRASVTDYMYEIIHTLNRNPEPITLVAIGENICKLADIVARLRDEMPGDIEIISWDISSKRVKGERKTQLEIEIRYIPRF